MRAQALHAGHHTGHYPPSPRCVTCMGKISSKTSITPVVIHSGHTGQGFENLTSMEPIPVTIPVKADHYGLTPIFLGRNALRLTIPVMPVRRQGVRPVWSQLCHANGGGGRLPTGLWKPQRPCGFACVPQLAVDSFLESLKAP